jgi:hypothetical protein
MAEGVQGVACFDVDLERVAGLGVEDRDDDLIGGLVPEQTNVDAVAVAAIEFSDHRSAGVAPGLDVEERVGGLGSRRSGSSVMVGVVMAASRSIRFTVAHGKPPRSALPVGGLQS